MPRGRKSKKKQEQKKLNITVAILIVLSILLAVLIYTKSGYLGQTLSPALGGVLGYIKYLVPIALFAFSLYIAYDKDTKYYLPKIFMFVCILVLIDVVFSCFQVSKGNIDISKSMDSILKQAYTLGTMDIGGGVLGTAIAAPLINLIGLLGTVIASIGVGLIALVFIFGLHPADAISNSIDKFAEKQARRSKEREQAREEQKQNVANVEPVRHETRKERKLREKQEKEAREKENLEEQITINLNEPKKYDHSKDNLDASIFSKKNANSPRQVIQQTSSDDLFTSQEEEKEAKTKEVLQLDHGITVHDEHYEFPPITLLEEGENKSDKNSEKRLLATAEKLRRTLHSFGVSAKVENVSVGPAITRYELAPAEGVRVSKIANLSDDIALALEAETIRIEAPIPGKHTVGIEVPNKEKNMVPLRDIIESDEFINSKSKLAFALGKDVAGSIVVTDIAKMPHMLIAGQTGSGKSVCINTLITSIIYKAKPSEVKLLMIDPKVVELSVYNGIPHLLIPVVTDPKKAAGALAWAVQEMVKRYSLFAEKKVRDMKGYNSLAEKEGNPKLPQIVIIIDELADLMMVAAKDVEDAICRLAQMARAAGMHLVIATQRPSVDVITGIIKANIPSRIAFSVSSQVDSRTILDSAGAEKLLGKGDMLFYPSGAPKPVRIQGAFISDKEVENIVKFLKKDGETTYDADIIESIEKSGEPDKAVAEDDEEDDTDPLLNEAIDLVVETGQASTSFIQRRFKVGYARAGRIIDQMEQRGIISGYQGSKPREVLMSKERWQELKMAPADSQVSNDGATLEVEASEQEG